MKKLNTYLNNIMRFIFMILLFSSFTTPSNAFFGWEPVFKFGAIYARDLIKGENGKPIYVVFDADTGLEIQEIGEAFGKLEKARTLSANIYNGTIAQYDNLIEANPDLVLIPKAEFTPQSYVTVNQEPIINIPGISDDTLYVLVIAENQRYSTDGSNFIIREFSINPELKLDSNLISSLLLLEDGTIHRQTKNNIGFRVGFFGQNNLANGVPGDRSATDKIYGPLAGIPVEVVGNKGAGVTNEEGKFIFPIILPPCPGFVYTYSTNTYAEVYYRRFSPRGVHNHPYYMARNDTSICNGLDVLLAGSGSIAGLMTGLAVSAINTAANNDTNTDFPVDIMVLSGVANIKNPDNTAITLADNTTYNHENQTFEREAQKHYDLDGDGKDDIAVLGDIVEVIEADGTTVKKFKRIAGDATPAAKIQGVWLSSVNDTTTLDSIKILAVNSLTTILPDLSRLPDWKADFKDRGLLKEISKLDFRNTDLYVFRESNGALIAERKGLKPEDIATGNTNEGSNDGTGVLEGKYFYNMLVLGNIEGIFNDFGYVKGEADFSQWQQGIGILDPKLHKRRADHLRPGEQVKLVAINRVTGYIGSLRTTLTAASSDEIAGWVAFAQEEMEMRPPNLKIWAKRYSEVKAGLTEGEEREYQIANEGAGLVDDEQIIIFTEWIDQDGSPLPTSLTKEYAYTGRIAQIVDNFKLDTVGQGVQNSANALSHFSIKPGRHIQVIRTPDEVANKQHFYVQVSAQPATEASDFGSTGIHQGILEHRPDNFVPFKVPLYDESESDLVLQAYRKAKTLYQENNNGAIPTEEELKKPEPFFQWVYRPEFQFSVYDLEVTDIKDVNVIDESVSILDDSVPFISSTDQLLELYYSLTTTNFPELEAYSYLGLKELTFAFGETEINATIDEEQNISFEDIDQLSLLNPEELLSIRLYANNDVSNILWEFAFTFLNIEVADDNDIYGDDIVYVSADDPKIRLSTTLLGYSLLDDDLKSRIPKSIEWKVISGNAYFSSPLSIMGDTGTAFNTLNLIPNSSNIVKVEAKLANNDSSKTVSFDIGVVPGKPSTISLTSTGEAYIKARGEVTVSALIKDKNGNLVTNGTPALFKEKGHINLKSYTGLSKDGIITGKLTGGSIAGTYTLDVTAGYASSSIEIPVQMLTVDILGIPQNLNTGVKYNLKAVITNGQQFNLENIFIDLGSDLGSITSRERVTNSSGEIAFTYKAPTTPGIYNVAAKLDLNNPVVKEINAVQPVTKSKLKPENYFIISGLNNLSQSEILNYSGTPSSLTYSSSNKLILTGTPGNNWDVNLDDYHFINREPIYFSRFSNIGRDQNHQYSASYNLVNNLKSPYDGIFSLDFYNNEDVIKSKWSIVSFEQAEIPSPAYNFWINVRTEGQILNIADGKIKLLYSGTNVIAEIVLSDNSVKTLTLPMPLNQWKALSVGVKNNNFYLSVDEQVQTNNLAGLNVDYSSILSQTDSEFLIVGDGFTGSVAGLRIYDWDSLPLIALDQSSGVYDLNGDAELLMSLTPEYQTNAVSIPAVTVAINDNLGNETTINILDEAVVRKYSSTYFSVYQQASVDSVTLLQKMPLDNVFSDELSGATELVQRFVVSGNRFVAKELVLANIGWLSHKSDYKLLHNKVVTLQNYFVDENIPHMAEYAAEYFQEATVQSHYGNSFWLRSLTTGLTVLAEMIESDPAIATFMANAIVNRTDFWTWIRLLSLPANGWITESIPLPRYDMTCDKVTANVNQNTPLAFSTTPCRASGYQMATLIKYFIDNDALITANPKFLTTYISTFMAGLKHAPLEYKKLFTNAIQTSSWNINLNPISEAHAVGPLVLLGYGVRVTAIIIKQLIRKGAAGAPANFVAFLQGGTTSRITPLEMMTALAYLGTRLEDGDCDGCVKLETQVSETVISDMTSWFLGMGLAKKGEVAEGGVKRKTCALSNRAHGKGFEILGTAMYHMLYEFGSYAGISNPQKYQILLADPRKRDDIIKVGLMQKNGSKLEQATGSPYQRKPDLVLFGEGEGQREWIELKSWRYNAKYLNKKTKQLYQADFPLWDGFSRQRETDSGKKTLKYTTYAHRQHFLDYAASQDQLTTDYWKEEGYFANKPTTHKTWVQIWKEGQRKWRALIKRNGKYQLEQKYTVRNVATPWIKKDDLDLDIVTTVPVEFQALQQYLSTAPSKLNKSTFLQTIGYPYREHDAKYVKGQVSSSIADLNQSTVLPFNIMTFLSLEVGDDARKKLWDKIISEFSDGEFADIQKKILDNTYTQTDIENLRENLTEKMLEVLGPLGWLAWEIPVLSYVEDEVADMIMGAELDEIRQAAAEYELGESDFENACEPP